MTVVLIAVLLVPRVTVYCSVTRAVATVRTVATSWPVLVIASPFAPRLHVVSPLLVGVPVVTANPAGRH